MASLRMSPPRWVSGWRATLGSPRDRVKGYASPATAVAARSCTTEPRVAGVLSPEATPPAGCYNVVVQPRAVRQASISDPQVSERVGPQSGFTVPAPTTL